MSVSEYCINKKKLIRIELYINKLEITYIESSDSITDLEHVKIIEPLATYTTDSTK